MSVVDQLMHRLEQPGIDGANVDAAEGSDRFLVRVDQAGSLAVTCWELRLTTDRLAGVTIERVRAVAEEVTRRVTYLLEPIQPIEADAEACIVQMRSVEPDERGDTRTYYEALAKKGGTISLQRFEAQRGAMRTSVAMTLTKEIIERLAEDFLASVS
ncbi:MAG: hypothetical protein AAGF31_04575 [Planctomycetota bacterium]